MKDSLSPKLWRSSSQLDSRNRSIWTVENVGSSWSWTTRVNSQHGQHLHIYSTTKEIQDFKHSANVCCEFCRLEFCCCDYSIVLWTKMKKRETIYIRPTFDSWLLILSLRGDDFSHWTQISQILACLIWLFQICWFASFI